METTDYEKLGSFYLGKEYDVSQAKLTDRLLLYDARDLTTHGVCVGMTGSGKTGLCIDLLEEAAVDGIPALIIDPKGDITNLLLQFPELEAEDFQPWINPDDARRKGLTQGQFAQQQAELWRTGLAQWGQSPERIAKLKGSTDFAIYTPGSDAGIPISILHSFAAPALSWEEEGEALREQVQGTVSALLGLIGVEADPLRSREHILLSNLFEYYWRRNEPLDLAKLILAIQEPPVRKLGVFDVDTFFPGKDRFALSLLMNNLIASPSFQSWVSGQPLDIPGFLATPNGKPRHSIFYIAYLNDAERMFFVTLLLNQVITWMRKQSGTTSLRALLYMDEIFGFFPPASNPPSKQPMLTLLKQARAFGLGILLTTQNPVDLDYKGLTNASTWFVGRLQAERDKERLLDGLESAASTSGQTLKRQELDQLISGLSNRVFLLHNVNEEAPVVFQTRWAMCYLRGPLTKPQVKILMGDRQPDIVAAAPNPLIAGQPTAPIPPSPGESQPPAGQGFRQVYLPPATGAVAGAGSVQYSPALLGQARLHFVDAKRQLDQWQDLRLLLPINQTTLTPQWEQAQPVAVSWRDQPEPSATFAPLSATINEAKDLQSLARQLEDFLYRTRRITLLFSAAFKAYSQPDESERDFRLHLSQLAREKRDQEVDKLRSKYQKKLDTLEQRRRKAEAIVAKEAYEAKSRSQEVWVSAGESLLGAFLGRRSMRSASTTTSKVRQSSAAKIDAEQAKAELANTQQEITLLESELRQQIGQFDAGTDLAAIPLERVEIPPRKSDIASDLILAWMPG